MDLKFSTLTAKLKGGQAVVIRQGLPADGSAWLDLIKAYLKDTDTIPLTSEEFESNMESADKHIQKYAERPNDLLLVAEYEGQIIGNIDLTSSPRQRLAHSARIGMGIASGWRNQGLGKALLKGVLDWARDSSNLELIWLDVYANNTRGIMLYKNMGFIECGTMPNRFKHDNAYFDNLKMYLPLKEA